MRFWSTQRVLATGGIGANRERPGEFFYDNLMMGTSRAEARFGFRARIPFQDGLRQTVRWYLEQRSIPRFQS